MAEHSPSGSEDEHPENVLTGQSKHLLNKQNRKKAKENLRLKISPTHKTNIL